ncbi:glycine-rich domain-containing protein [Mycobacterium camsae]|uniref:hypothetical protein n=1 Tax=Mycobacterium gordonae TaxID=1778 RepID=UPI0019808F5D|nr:hypothetical protein [Mycobacterium gordonae]
MLPKIVSAQQSPDSDGRPLAPALIDRRHREALAFEAPYLIDRLVHDRVARDPESAENLFSELKKYFVLCAVSADEHVAMHSRMVDEAWHTFILFTSEYADYGYRYFDKFLHHAPNVEASHMDWLSAAADDDDHHNSSHRQNFRNTSFQDFGDRYKELFGEALPAVWYDEHFLTPASRVINDRAGQLGTRIHSGTVELFDVVRGRILSVNALGGPALNFIAQHQDFYIRELGDTLADDEKLGLSRALIGVGVLRIAF